MLRNERLLDRDNLVETDVGVEGGFDVAEGDDGAISTVSSACRSVKTI